MAEGYGTVNLIVIRRTSGQPVHMRAFFVLIVGVWGLAACGPIATFYQAGAPVALMEDTLLDCRVAALQDAPVSTQVRQGPPRYIPGPYYCHRDGRCYRSGGYFAPGEVYTIDTNEGLRTDLTTRCMARAGFDRVELPRCPAGTSAPDLSSDAGTMPALAADSCIRKSSGGSTQIISPAG